jgi:hypothetical protein
MLFADALLVEGYGCETWFLAQREEHGFRVQQSSVLRKIFGSKRNEVTGGWRKLQKEDIHNFHFVTNVIGVIESRRRWIM